MAQSDGQAPIAKVVGIMFVSFIMPVLLIIVWRMALGIDALNLTILMKGNGEVTHETPGHLRIIGTAVIGLGLFLAGAAVNALRKAKVAFWEAAMMGLAGLEIAGFGAGVFMTAEVAMDAIELEQRA